MTATATVECPMCGGQNPATAVFCENPACHKALGEFKYVEEELAASAHWHQALAEKVSTFIGRPHFIVLHVLWFLVWIGFNSSLVAMSRRFDDYPFSLLGIILTIEAIFITAFILVSQNRQNAHDQKQAELEYEVSVLTYREMRELNAQLETVMARLDGLEQAVASLSNAAGREEQQHESGH